MSHKSLREEFDKLSNKEKERLWQQLDKKGLVPEKPQPHELKQIIDKNKNKK